MFYIWKWKSNTLCIIPIYCPAWSLVLSNIVKFEGRKVNKIARNEEGELIVARSVETHLKSELKKQNEKARRQSKAILRSGDWESLNDDED